MINIRREKRVPAGIIFGLVAFIFLLALWLRAFLPQDKVFSGAWIKFADPDSYYHMRLVENLLNHFPRSITFDPFTYFPHGTSVFWPPFFDWLMAGIIWLLGSGSPSQRLMDLVGAYYPAILGALTVIPVYFIGKELFNRWVGIIAAGLVAILPSEFLSRSLLGNPDHHVAEVLFTTSTILFLILALKSAKKVQLNFKHAMRPDWTTMRKPLFFSVIAGISLGIYMLSWVGGLFFVLLLFVYFVVQSAVDQLRKVSIDYLGIISFVLFLVAGGISLPFLTKDMNRDLSFPAFIIAALAPTALVAVTKLLKKIKLSPIYYPLILLGFGLLITASVFIIDRGFLNSMMSKLEIFTPSGAALYISEVQPALFIGGHFTFNYVWGTLTTGFFLSFASLGVLVYLIFKEDDPSKTLLFCWSVLMLLAMFGQRRFEYYYTVNVALLTAYLSWRALSLFGYRDRARPEDSAKISRGHETRPKKRKKGKLHFPSAQLRLGLGAIVVFFVVVFPNIVPAIKLARSGGPIPGDAWYSALYWLKDNTPDPFEDPSYYYADYPSPPVGQDYAYPQSAYGVMAAWDYGHMITELAHRIPISNPFQQGAMESSQFFTAQDSLSANEIMDKLGGRYVILDYETAYTKFFNQVGFAGQNIEDFYATYYQSVSGNLEPVVFFYPAYYLSTAARLYFFNGQSVEFQKTIVISYEYATNPSGSNIRVIKNDWAFDSYDEAKTYIAQQHSGNYVIGNFNPSVSPIPLEGLDRYTLVYQSEAVVQSGALKGDPLIKIFISQP